MFRTLPPTAAPIRFRDFISGIALTFSDHGAQSRFEDQIREYFNVKHVFLVSSGKAALSVSLDALRQYSKRNEVIIPAYSSFCLASAVARSGLSVKLCDIDPETLDFDRVKLRSQITEDTLAVIPVHNYGLVCNLKEIVKLCNEKGAYVVEDAAQAAGALFENRKIGTIGDVGVLSLGRGKNICALAGGVILTDKEPIARLIDQVIGKYSRPSMFSNLKPFSTGLGLSLFLHPGSYTIPARLPFLNLGANIFDPNFEITRLPNLNAGVGQKTFSNLDRLNETRIQNARLLKNSLTMNGTIRIPKANPDGKSIYLRFPILFKSREIRDQAFQLLNQRRLGASLSYPAPLNQIADFKKYLSNDGNFPGAQYVSETILTLPTHPFVTESDIERIVAAINQVVSSKL